MDERSRVEKPNKNARLEVRVTQEYKSRVETAAYLRGQNMTEYVLEVLADASAKTIQEHQILYLAKRDAETFAEALLNPAPTSERAIADANWYKEVIENNDRD